jgi:hypothetical protein
VDFVLTYACLAKPTSANKIVYTNVVKNLGLQQPQLKGNATQVTIVVLGPNRVKEFIVTQKEYAIIVWVLHNANTYVVVQRPLQYQAQQPQLLSQDVIQTVGPIPGNVAVVLDIATKEA